MEQQPKIMGMGDVMKTFGVSRQRVVEFIRQGKLHPIRTSAGKIFTENEVMAFKKDRDERKTKKSKAKTKK